MLYRFQQQTHQRPATILFDRRLSIIQRKITSEDFYFEVNFPLNVFILEVFETTEGDWLSSSMNSFTLALLKF